MLCIEGVMSLLPDGREPGPDEVPGFVISIRNRGRADAIDVSWALSAEQAQGGVRRTQRTPVTLRPDDIKTMEYEFGVVDYSHYDRFQLVMEYQDFDWHRAVFNLEKPSRFGAPRLTFAKLDGRPHPARRAAPLVRRGGGNARRQPGYRLPLTASHSGCIGERRRLRRWAEDVRQSHRSGVGTSAESAMKATASGGRSGVATLAITYVAADSFTMAQCWRWAGRSRTRPTPMSVYSVPGAGTHGNFSACFLRAPFQ
jgi:hypothetical protein